MNTKQYTITEENDWEGETFGYIMDLTDDEVALITKGLTESEFHSIEQSSHTPEDVALVNKHSDNSYMPRLGFYEFKEPLVDMIADNDACIDGDDDYDEIEKEEQKEQFLTNEVFYKGAGLNRIKK